MLVDLDIVCYRASAVAWDNTENGITLALETLTTLRDVLKPSKEMLFLSGDRNFRKTIYPEYKANRIKMERPPCLEEVKSWFIEQNLVEPIQEHLEADDLLGLHQTEDSCIVSIDKDLLMIPGWHYNYVKDDLCYVSEWAGIYAFYRQLLVGDPADNIKGAKGIGKAKAEKILANCTTESELLKAVEPYFSCFEELDMTASCLWIQRKGRVNWNAV
ncbi:MAG TPA: hypothetical protein VFM18_01520 [Methanosarcina sp.]|nr:hypothetical protein [Methanosarcina sp.]